MSAPDLTPDLAQDLADFTAKFRVDELLVHAAQGWALSVRPAQTTLGAMVLSVQSGTQDLAGLSVAEHAGMGAAMGQAETLARDVFGAVRINLLCLMMQDPVVHFHILPRYGAPQDFAGHTWEDVDWPGPPVITGTPTDTDALILIRDALRAAL